jgi:hypothetical protein
MKTLTILGTLLLASGTYLFADAANTAIYQPPSSKNEVVTHDVTGFSNPYTGPGKTKESIERPPNMHPDLKPQPGGIVTDTAKYGPVMLSPTAPASYGMGEKYLTAPSSQYDLPHQSGFAAHRDSGGFKLFSIEF